MPFVPFFSSESFALCLTAMMVGAAHTLLGPDHYVPFVAMSRAGGWTFGKTLRVTVACGLAHVAGSVLIGLVGLGVGLAISRLETVEAFRGDLAAWLMIGFGLSYLTWGLVQASHSPWIHEHVHAHADGSVRSQPQTPGMAHPHVQGPSTSIRPGGATPIWSPWFLFLVFAFGPCEPLIPLLMYPAAKAGWWAVVAVALSFAAATIATMGIVVAILRSGTAFVSAQGLQRYAHAFAGIAILGCGLLITLGL